MLYKLAIYIKLIQTFPNAGGIPNELGNLLAVEKIDLSNNQLTGTFFWSFSCL